MHYVGVGGGGGTKAWHLLYKVIGKSHIGFLCVVCFVGSHRQKASSTPRLRHFSAAHIHVAIVVHVHVLLVTAMHDTVGTSEDIQIGNITMPVQCGLLRSAWECEITL